MAKVTKIEFTDEGPAPTLELTKNEAALLFKIIGSMPTFAKDEVMRDGSELGSGIYDELASKWAYCYWEDGDPRGDPDMI